MMEWIEQIARIAAPYVLLAQAGVLAERSGVIDVALEGKLLCSAFCAAVGSLASGSAWLGLMAGIGGALALAALQGLSTVRLRANHVVIGVALNLLAVGVTRFFLRLWYGSSSNSPRVEAAFGAGMLLLVVAAALMCHLLLFRTRLGLRLRACGEHPEAVLTMGVSVLRVRLMALVLGAVPAGLAGVSLTYQQHGFVDLMSGGRGFIAIAALIFGRWRPFAAALAALLFACAEAGQIVLQSAGLGLPSVVLNALPHALTVIVLAGLVGRQHPPRALGGPVPD